MRKSHDFIEKKERKEWNHIQETSVLKFDVRNFLKEASFEKSATAILIKLVAWAGIHIIPRSYFNLEKELITCRVARIVLVREDFCVRLVVAFDTSTGAVYQSFFHINFILL